MTHYQESYNLIDSLLTMNLNNIVFMSRNYWPIVAPWKFDVFKTNSIPRSEALRADSLVLRTSKISNGQL